MSKGSNTTRTGGARTTRAMQSTSPSALNNSTTNDNVSLSQTQKAAYTRVAAAVDNYRFTGTTVQNNLVRLGDNYELTYTVRNRTDDSNDREVEYKLHHLTQQNTSNTIRFNRKLVGQGSISWRTRDGDLNGVTNRFKEEVKSKLKTAISHRD